MLVRPRTLGIIWPWDPETIWPWDVFIPGAIAKKVAMKKATETIATPALTPPAPQTEAKLKTWTLEDLWEAINQKQQAFIESGGTAVGMTSTTSQAFPWWLVICTALAATAIGIRMAARRT